MLNVILQHKTIDIKIQLRKKNEKVRTLKYRKLVITNYILLHTVVADYCLRKNVQTNII